MVETRAACRPIPDTITRPPRAIAAARAPLGGEETGFAFSGHGGLKRHTSHVPAWDHRVLWRVLYPEPFPPPRTLARSLCPFASFQRVFTHILLPWLGYLSSSAFPPLPPPSSHPQSYTYYTRSVYNVGAGCTAEAARCHATCFLPAGHGVTKGLMSARSWNTRDRNV